MQKSIDAKLHNLVEIQPNPEDDELGKTEKDKERAKEINDLLVKKGES